jgi:hypothetical protein
MDLTAELQTRVIDLAELRLSDEFPAYAAIYCPGQVNPFVLSPTAMRWSEKIILFRLEECRSFWLNQKKKLRCKLTELLDALLRHHYGDGYVAVFGEHPWQCLLYLDYQLRQQAQGLYLLQARLNRNIYQTLDWDCWFNPQARLAEHLLAINAAGFRPDSFSARQSRMRRFIQRIGVASPYEMSAADSNSIRRRFGKWLGLIWQWSFSDSGKLDYFPWISLQQAPRPAVTRDLDYPVSQWSYIEQLLREDLERLCDQFNADETEHINRMQWGITLFNQQKVTVELSFRHPYSLHRDRPGFDTALYQARYIYDDLMLKLQARDTDLDLPESMPFICWRVEVCERVMLAPLLWDLFAGQYDAIDYQRVMALQNKLPLAFECYQSDPSYFPEQSFTAAPLGEPRQPGFDHYPWSCSATNKPLFYYPSAQPIENPGRMQRIFLERNANQWWLGEDALQTIRDYFILKDRRGRSSWVYRTQDGAWFKQGEFC